MTEPFRILHVVTILNRGGMESRLMDQYRNLDRNRFQFDFYVESGKHAVFDTEVEQLGGQVFYPETLGRHGMPNFRSWKHFLDGHPYGMVFAYNQWAGWYLREAKKHQIPARIAYARTSLQTVSAENIIKNIIKLNVNRYATHKFAVSKKAGTWLFGEKAVENSEVRVWPNAIDTEKFRFEKSTRDRIREELGFGDESVVMHVGNLRMEKNHPFLFEVFAALVKIHPDMKLVLVGKGTMDQFNEKLDSLGIRDKVIHLGVRKDVPDLLQAADVFVFPSFYEGFPGAVLEAETSGLPCFISDTITEEVVLTDQVKQLSLKEAPAKWAERISEALGKPRMDCVDAIKAAGYDIHELSQRMEAFYSGYEKRESVHGQ